jgi:hypothetical protein
MSEAPGGRPQGHEPQGITLTEIAKLELTQGDILVVKFPKGLSAIQQERVRRQLDDFLGLKAKGVKTLFLPYGMSLEVLKEGVNG